MDKSSSSFVRQNKRGVFDVQITQLKRRFRLAMNGVVSTNMKDRGIDYALNFGVALPILRKMASEMEPSRPFAEALWLEPVRECRIMATLLLPHSMCDHELLQRWIEHPVQHELIEQLAMNVTSRLSSAEEWAKGWICSDRTDWQLLGFLTLGRIQRDATTEESLCKELDRGLCLIQQGSVYLNAVTSAWDRLYALAPSSFTAQLEQRMSVSSIADTVKEYLRDLYREE